MIIDIERIDRHPNDMHKDRVGEAYRDEICAWWGDECPVGCIRCIAEKLATIEGVENDAVGE